MFRPSAGKSAAAGNATNTSPNKRESGDNAPSTIREIRSRTLGGQSPSSASSAARQLLANRRQAMSMERLNGGSAPNVASSNSMTNMHNFSDKNEKGSPMNGSSNSISGSTASSPSRGSSASSSAGLNRTASRVSRFRSAKAVFERLSSANSASGAASKPDRAQALAGLPGEPRPKGTVASRYAAAAAARGAAAQQSQSGSNAQKSSPRSRLNGNRSPLRTQSHDSLSNSKSSTQQTSAKPKQESPPRPPQPRPQPRVIATATRRAPAVASARQSPEKNPKPTSNSRSTSASAAASSSASQASQSKPPPKDLIDKIVLEIVRDAKNEHDANCTIQDLSNCDTSGIPETLDFDKCFQDVEMMTEEEARKLLSRKSESPADGNNPPTSPLREGATSADESPQAGPEVTQEAEPAEPIHQLQYLDASEVMMMRDANAPFGSSQLDQAAGGTSSSGSLAPAQQTVKSKVRFSDEPVTVYDTHAPSDYDRRNDDIDPVAASAEYEIEKSREREGISHHDEEEEDKPLLAELGVAESGRQRGAVGAVIESFNQQHQSIMKISADCRAGSHTPQSAGAAHHARHDDRRDSSADNNQAGRHSDFDEDDQTSSRKDYIESLEREVSIKRILEQNLRDLQSQYYETVKQLDSYKGDAETKLSKLEDELTQLGDRHEAVQGELADSREQSNQLEKQLNDIKESSQLLEKKYHRAKRIIKDMQSREESFTRREQLYQQKLDEIEYELGVLINTIDKTIYEEGLKYFSLNSTDGNSCSRQHQTRLDVLGLIKQIMDNFNNNKKTQSAQIKQRIVTMLEQQLASLLASSNGCTSITAGPVVPIPPVVPSNAGKLIATSIASHPSKPLQSINNNNNNNNNNEEDGKHSQNYSYASHRLSQPNMPHPIGVGGQPTKIFHGLNNMPLAATLNEPSPPQSVNSYPSTNSLNSLNNNNNNNGQQTATTGSSSATSRMQDTHPLSSLGEGDNLKAPQTSSSLSDEVFQQATPDVQVPYQTNEWHDKPVSEWTTTQVSTWLLALGLDQYISKFEDRNVNGQSLINLDSTVLKGLGVLNSNDRNLLKKKIRELRVEMEKERKIFEKKMKENLKEKSKVQPPSQTGKQSWKKSLLS